MPITSALDGGEWAAALTLILLTWRIWWANNTSIWQMGFNSAFIGLNPGTQPPVPIE
jgi:hypothetical protein